MDQMLQAFREAAAAEHRGLRPLQRRYSPTLRARAVAYWRTQHARGVGLDAAAAALGVAPWSLTTVEPHGDRAAPPLSRRAGRRGRAPDADAHDPRDSRRRACRRPRRGDRGAAAGAVAMRWHGRRVTVYAYAGLHAPNRERHGPAELVEEVQARVLIEATIQAQHPEARAVVQRCVLKDALPFQPNHLQVDLY
jgi:hypothetical protein